ncbi:MAG: RNA polymerase sigma-70 factor [Dehalococcoidia bacterium]
MTATPELSDRTFEEHRSLLFGVAYRMLGTVAEAEDAVQDSYLRYRSAEGPIANSRAYLVTIVTRICLDVLKSARVKREQYIGVWLPEPLVEHSASAPSPEATVETEDSVSYAFLVMLEELGPVERAVFLLREVFDYDYGDIAQVVMKSEAACRQVFHRARQHLNERHHRHRASYDQRRDLTARFLAAANEGNMAGLLEILSDDVVAYSDGGGKVAAAINPIFGADHVARFTIGVTKKEPLIPELADINGAPGVLLRTRSGRLSSVLLLEVDEGKVTAMYAIRNPDKLGRAG